MRDAKPPQAERPDRHDPSRIAHSAPRLPPILCFHKVEPRYELGVTRLSPRRFAAQIERLVRAGWKTLTLAELVACARGERSAAPHELAITFDDAYRGLRDHAFPVLEANGLSAVCFVISEYAGRLNRWDVAYGGRRFAHLAWRDMRRWQQRGIEFASHTATHPRLTWLEERAVWDELERSRRDIASTLDAPCDAVSYPFGACGERERRLAELAGYTSGFVLVHRWRGDPRAIPRTPVYAWSPAMPVVGVFGRVERLCAAGVSRCSLATTLLRWASGAHASRR
jgi:peptidoglycan/xylan/chitin deacetylase (PgdA/CDA1 family)